MKLLDELETDDEIIQYIRKQDRNFHLDAKGLYCLAEAAGKVIGDVGQKAVDEVEGGRFGDLPIGAFVRGKNVILPQGTTVTVQSPRDFRIEATGS